MLKRKMIPSTPLGLSNLYYTMGDTIELCKEDWNSGRGTECNAAQIKES
jgi:hypothetical protein